MYDERVARDEGMRVTGVIQSIELHTLAGKFKDVTTRQVAKVALEIERATDEDGEEIDVDNLAGMHFVGPPELVPHYSVGERVQIVTSPESSLHITNIKLAPLS